MEKTNLGVRPLGRGETASPRVQAENAALKNYKEGLAAAGPANSTEAGKLHRAAWEHYDQTIRAL